MARFDQGEEVEFGDLAVSRAGLRYEGETTPWAQIKKVGMERGFLTIRRTTDRARKPWVNRAVVSVPNIDILFDLIARGQSGGSAEDRR